MLKCKYRWTEIGVSLKFILNVLWLRFLKNSVRLYVVKSHSTEVWFPFAYRKDEPPAFLKK